MKGRYLAGWALALVFPVVGQAARLPGYLIDAQADPHPDCDPATHIFAVASSKEGPEDAKLSAKTSVTRRVDSAIASEVERIVELSSVDGEVHANRRLEERVIDKSTFGHGALIQPVGETVRHKGRYFALACLDRAAVTRALRADLADPLARHTAGWQAGLAAAKKNDRSGFTRQYRDAMAVMPTLLAGLAQVSAAAGALVPEAATIQEHHRELVRTAAGIRAEVRFGLNIDKEAFPEPAAGRIIDSVRGALQEIGVDGGEMGALCSGRHPPTYSLEVSGNAGYRWGTMGHTYQPRVRVRATECETGAVVFDAGIEDKRLTAHDFRDKARALEKALRAMTPVLVRTHIEVPIRSEVPVDE